MVEKIISKPDKSGLGKTGGVKIEKKVVPPSKEPKIVISNFWSSGSSQSVYIDLEKAEELIEVLEEVEQ